VQESDLSLLDENIIKNPKLLNIWCRKFSESESIDPHYMCAIAVEHFEDKIPLNKIYEIIEPQFKNSNQRQKALMKKPKKATKKQWLKSNTKALGIGLKNGWIEMVKDIANKDSNVNAYTSD